MSKQQINIEHGRYWDRPWGLVSSCTRCSTGCQNCWALAMEKRFHKGIEGKVEIHPERLDIPLKVKKPTIFSIWNDLFHEAVSNIFRDLSYIKMLSLYRHTFLVLTKRPHIMAKYLLSEIPYIKDNGTPEPDLFKNVWHGLTICNQQEADEKIPIFLQVPGKKFLNVEPMLGPINLGWKADDCGHNGLRILKFADNARWRCGYSHNDLGPVSHAGRWRRWEVTGNHLPEINAVILGGETGPGARPVQLDWIRSVRDQCEAAGVPFFLKHIDKKHGRILDGRTHDELPWMEERL